MHSPRYYKPSLVNCFLPADKLKDNIIAKIAMQAADLYADAYSNMQVGSVKQMWDKVRYHLTWSCDIRYDIM